VRFNVKDGAKELKKFRLAQRLDDPRQLILALRYYDAHLLPGKWVELPAPRRERSRKLSRAWLAHLTAARRILGVVARRMKATRTPPEELVLFAKAKREAEPQFHGNLLLDRKGRPRIKYYLRRDVWETVDARLSSIQVALPKEERFFQRVGLDRDRTTEHLNVICRHR
jgi:hypothetical protein